jgi:hypothetical protein
LIGVPLYGFCGGESYEGPTNIYCEEGECTFLDEYFYACWPTSTTSSVMPTSTICPGCAALFAQCGGQGFSGSTTCAQGRCFYYNPYFSFCLEPCSDPCPSNSILPLYATMTPTTSSGPAATTVPLYGMLISFFTCPEFSKFSSPSRDFLIRQILTHCSS